MVDPKRWPNLLSSLRIALMPAMLAIAWAGSRPWFLAVAAASLATDVLDGFLARRFNAFSDLGRKLDSIADYLTMVTGLAGIALLWPVTVRQELLWIATGLVVFVGSIAFGMARLGRPPFYHTWATKAGVIGCALSLIPLLTGWSAIPFHAMIVLLGLAAAEGVAITVIVPSHRGEMRSVWHALRLRRQQVSSARCALRPPEAAAPVK